MLRVFVPSRCRANICLLVARHYLICKPCPKFVDKKKSHPWKASPAIKTNRRLLHEGNVISGPLTEVVYDQLCEATLDSLCEYFEDLLEQSPHLNDSDISLGDGVLTINFGASNGTYVINRQRPNLQIWLSSPTSGPKRYDFINGQWVYKHDGISLHDLLEKEISKIVEKSVDLSNCAYSQCK